VSRLEPAHRVRLHEPEIGARDVCFRWEVTPSSDFYQRCDFRLQFPAGLQPEEVPRALWWRVGLLCLYTHWAFLRPCRVELPVRLGAGELEFWMRLTDNVASQLEAYGSAPRPGRAAELVERGRRLEALPLRGGKDRAAVAFSGGKDSLALTAMLAELNVPTLLVTATSPVEWSRDQVGVGRERAMAEVVERLPVERLPVELVEVTSDFRSCWTADFAARDGCRLPVNQLTDLPFFQAVTVAAAAAAGARRLFMASETDCQYSAVHEGRVVQHCEFVGSAASQGALDALLSRFGMRQGSLTCPLHMPQVQALLWHRYPELAELQFSCYQAPEGERACSVCPKCFQIALVMVAEGVAPRALGIDLAAALSAFGHWHLDAPTTYAPPQLHPERIPRHHVVRVLQEVPTTRIAALIEEDPGGSGEDAGREAIAVYERLRSEALPLEIPPAPGYVSGYLEMIHPDLREGLRAIFAEHFPPAPAEEFAGMVERSREFAAWVSEPLADRAGWRLRRSRRGVRAAVRAR